MKIRSNPLAAILLAWIAGSVAFATSIIPISDRELYERADVIVHGIVVSSDVTVDGEGRPEMLTVIEPLEVLKGRLSGNLVLHQLGGRLPDGRFFKLWGAPEYLPGREVIVFAIARPQGEYQTAEMLLGKFDVKKDERGVAFAVPALESGYAQVTIQPRREVSEVSAPLSTDPAREVSAMLRSLRLGARHFRSGSVPQGKLSPVVHAVAGGIGMQPEWANIGGLWRYNNNATAVWTLLGTANITGGGAAEAQGATDAWNNDPHSAINQSIGGGPNIMNLDDLNTNGCGWTTCLSGGGVIGCGGPNGGGGSNIWRGETYNTITGGRVWLRSYCSFNGFGSVTTQAVLTHELGHSLGLGHSDQAASAHDTCRGDEGAAQMRSVVQGYIALGTDDQDAIRWLYGDGLTSCGPLPAPTVTSVAPIFGPVAGGTLVTVVGTNFESGATVAFGAASVASTFVNATTLKATAPAGSGTVGVTVTNPGHAAGDASQRLHLHQQRRLLHGDAVPGDRHAHR